MSLEQAILANTEATNALLAAIKALPADLAKQISNISLPSVSTGSEKEPKADKTKTEKKADPLAEFVASLATLNWKWADSDDPAVFKAGKAAEAAAKAKATELGAKALAAFSAAQTKGQTAEDPAPGTAATASTDTGTSEPVIALSDLQKLCQQIQAFKTKDAENGVKAIEELKEIVKWAGVARISDPNLEVAKYPEIKTRLEAVVSKFKIPALA
jgi:hypothetical protein